MKKRMKEEGEGKDAEEESVKRSRGGQEGWRRGWAAEAGRMD